MAPKTNNQSADQTVEVLYQKMGDRWFAFSQVDGEIFVGSISQEEIDALEAQKAGNTEHSTFSRKRTGNA